MLNRIKRKAGLVLLAARHLGLQSWWWCGVAVRMSTVILGLKRLIHLFNQNILQNTL